MLRSDLLLLSRVAQKQRAFEADTYFIEGRATLIGAMGPSAKEFAMNHSLLVVKPDAIVGRRVEQVVEWLMISGYAVVGAKVLRFNRHMIRAMWGYHWNAMTEEHKLVVDKLMLSGDALALIVRASAREQTGIPATVMLSGQKGSASPQSRTPGQLRYKVAFKLQLLNAVHSPDEPADLVRELAVLFEREERLQLLQDVVSGVEMSPEQLTKLTDTLYATNEYQNIERFCAEAAGIRARGVNDVALAKGAVLGGWNLLVKYASTVRNEIPGVERLIPKPGSDAWMSSINEKKVC